MKSSFILGVTKLELCIDAGTFAGAASGFNLILPFCRKVVSVLVATPIVVFISIGCIGVLAELK